MIHSVKQTRPLVLAMALALSACAAYSKLDLPPQPDLVGLSPAQDAQPLDMDAVATVAVLNNADLKATRAKAHVVAAQAFAAGLLPDPQFSGSIDHPTHPPHGFDNAYGLGLSFDLQALLMQPDKTAAANAALEQARLEQLWQEWQTVARARDLYVQRAIGLQRVEFFAAAEITYLTQSERSARALQNRDFTIEQSGSDIASLSDLRVQLDTARRNAAQADHALLALLGLAPHVSLPLQALNNPPIPPQEDVDHAIASLAQSRPDLRALKAGYEGQEKLVHKAVLAQFPNISVGFAKASDTSNVRTFGLSVALSLPLFDRGRGEIALQRATRAQLHAEYQARLDQAVADVWQLWDDMQQLQVAIAQMQVDMTQRQQMLDNAWRAYQAHDLPAAAYLTMLGAFLNGHTALFDLQQALWSDAIALATVLGTQIEPINPTEDSGT